MTVLLSKSNSALIMFSSSAAGSLPVSPGAVPVSRTDSMVSVVGIVSIPPAVPVSPALFHPHAVMGNANTATRIKPNIFLNSQPPLSSLFQIFSEIPEFFQL